MANYYMVSSTERSLLEANAPTGERIDSVVAGLRLYNTTMVGPRPRIVRRTLSIADWASGRGWETQVTWLVSRSVNQSIDVARHYIVERTQNALRPLGNWTPVSVVEYSPALNGPIEWWQSGQAAITQTHDAFANATSSAPPQNPVGPDSAAARPTTTLEDLRDLGGGLGNAAGSAVGIATKLVVLAGVVLAGVYVGPVVGPPLLAMLKARFGSRTNPSMSPEDARNSALLGASAVATVGGLGYLALASGGARAATPPVVAPATSPTPSTTTPRVTPAPAPAPRPAPSLPATLTDAERELSRALMADDIARKLRFWFQATMYSWRATNEAPTGLDSPETQRLTRVIQAMRGVPDDGVLNQATLRGVRTALDTLRRAAGGAPVRKISVRLWRPAVAAVNDAALAVAPGTVLLQVDALDA